jgi:hypothetical protein
MKKAITDCEALAGKHIFQQTPCPGVPAPEMTFTGFIVWHRLTQFAML